MPRQPDICDICKQEVRFGTRLVEGEPVEGWWHREMVEHHVRFGPPGPTAAEAEAARQAYLAAHADDEPDPNDEEAPPEISTTPEVRATPIDIDDPRLPGGAKQVIKLARKHGWTAVATYARGPWMHSTQWTPLSVSDHVLVRLRLDGEPSRAVASWRDGKFLSAWLWQHGKPGRTPANSDALKTLLKGET